MASLLNTTWTITATNHDFTTFTVKFAPNNVANVTFSTGSLAQGNWTQGPRNVVFNLQFQASGAEYFDMLGSHQDGQGSGMLYAEWSGGVQKSPFTMAKST
jgi:hypothetical protein